MPKKKKYIWVIAYINPEHIRRVKKDLERIRHEGEPVKGLKAFIPTVRVLKKQIKQKRTFTRVPMLFNYGFFRIPLKYAKSGTFMANMRVHVLCLVGWVQDQAITNKPWITSDQKLPDRLPYAQASDEEIARMATKAKEGGIHDKKNINELSPGDYVTLKGYPFEGLQATIKKVDLKKKEVLVSVEGATLFHEVKVHLDNLVYSVYQGHADNLMDHKALEDIPQSKFSNEIDDILINLE